MNRMFLFGIALFVAVLGIALVGGQTQAVAGDCCAPACCAAPTCCAAPCCATATCCRQHRCCFGQRKCRSKCCCPKTCARAAPVPRPLVLRALALCAPCAPCTCAPRALRSVHLCSSRLALPCARPAVQPRAASGSAAASGAPVAAAGLAARPVAAVPRRLVLRAPVLRRLRSGHLCSGALRSVHLCSGALRSVRSVLLCGPVLPAEVLRPAALPSPTPVLLLVLCDLRLLCPGGLCPLRLQQLRFDGSPGGEAVPGPARPTGAAGPDREVIISDLDRSSAGFRSTRWPEAWRVGSPGEWDLPCWSQDLESARSKPDLMQVRLFFCAPRAQGDSRVFIRPGSA